MTLKELELLNSLEHKQFETIKVEDLSNTEDRTLIYGYTCERKDFHVYIKDKKICVVIYRTTYSPLRRPEQMQEIIPTIAREYVPDKRIYPAACDFEFCRLLQDRGVTLPFTSYDDRDTNKKFFGFTLEDMDA